MSRMFPQIEMEPVYGFSHYLAATLAEMFFRGEIVGLEHLPRAG